MMVDGPQHNDLVNPGHLGPLGLSYEIQKMIAVEAISSASNGAEMGCFAAINKSWQILIEAETFRNIHVALLAKDQSGVNYLLPMLTPARLAHLEELTIDIEWPFFVSAQKKRRFSAADAVSQMFGTVLYLAFFLRRLGRVDRAPTARGLNIVLQTIRPARVAPTGSASQRIMERRRRLPAEISSWWSDADLLKLAPLQRRKWVRSTDAALFNECPAVHAVTGLAFPPDFFPPSTMQLLLGRFPNLRAMRLDPLCELRNPEGWRADFFDSQLQTVIPGSMSTLGPAPNITTLVLGRTFALELEDYRFEHLSEYNVHGAGSQVTAYIHAIRNYTRNLKALRFDHFAAPVHFYKCFFTGMPDSDFSWAKLEEVHISLYGDKETPYKRVPMALHDGAHLSPGGKIAVLELFRAAGHAVSRMPLLQKMTIHIPELYEQVLWAVTLQFAYQSRQDASLPGLWGAPGRLELWAAPRCVTVEEIWTQSVAKHHRNLQHIEWHSDECPDPMKGFDHWGKEMPEREKKPGETSGPQASPNT